MDDERFMAALLVDFAPLFELAVDFFVLALVFDLLEFALGILFHPMMSFVIWLIYLIKDSIKVTSPISQQ